MRGPRLLLQCLISAGLAALAGPVSAQTFSDGVAALSRSDTAEALRLFRNTASRGDAPSQFALAEMYRQGQGGAADPAAALAWYRKAADQDNPGAQFNLGRLYQLGQGARRNEALAADWYAKAAAHGYVPAELQLGLLYAQGHGVARSEPAAAAWFQKAADQGDAEARRQLGKIASDAYAPPAERFRTMMDKVFGSGHWRETSGYRTVAQEDALRRQGAGTVPMGQRSRHSMGAPDAPGAYDIVVAGMTPEQAAAKLKRSPIQLTRVVIEFAHGTQGPHLHVEPALQPIAVVKRADAAAHHTSEAGAYSRIAISTAATQAGRD